MRKYELTVNGRTFRIAVRSFSREAAELEVNGEPLSVRVDHVEDEGGPPAILPGKPRVLPGRATPAAAPAGARAVAAGEAGGLPAPIPGKITEIFVQEGEEVLAGEPVLKMEAMKMENVIRAPGKGVVRSIRVKVGDVVSQGQELMVIG